MDLTTRAVRKTGSTCSGLLLPLPVEEEELTDDMLLLVGRVQAVGCGVEVTSHPRSKPTRGSLRFGGCRLCCERERCFDYWVADRGTAKMMLAAIGVGNDWDPLELRWSGRLHMFTIRRRDGSIAKAIDTAFGVVWGIKVIMNT